MVNREVPRTKTSEKYVYHEGRQMAGFHIVQDALNSKERGFSKHLLEPLKEMFTRSARTSLRKDFVQNVKGVAKDLQLTRPKGIEESKNISRVGTFLGKAQEIRDSVYTLVTQEYMKNIPVIHAEIQTRFDALDASVQAVTESDMPVAILNGKDTLKSLRDNIDESFEDFNGLTDKLSEHLDSFEKCVGGGVLFDWVTTGLDMLEEVRNQSKKVEKSISKFYSALAASLKSEHDEERGKQKGRAAVLHKGLVLDKFNPSLQAIQNLRQHHKNFNEGMFDVENGLVGFLDRLIKPELKNIDTNDVRLHGIRQYQYTVQQYQEELPKAVENVWAKRDALKKAQKYLSGLKDKPNRNAVCEQLEKILPGDVSTFVVARIKEKIQKDKPVKLLERVSIEDILNKLDSRYKQFGRMLDTVSERGYFKKPKKPEKNKTPDTTLARAA